MINEIIDFYSGDLLTPLGRPHLVVVGQQFHDFMRCEKYILFEKSDGVNEYISEQINSSSITNTPINLENFVKHQGLENAEKMIYAEIFKLDNDDNFNVIKSKRSGMKLRMRKSNHTSFLLHMKMKSELQLNWIKCNTESKQLKDLIDLYKSFNISKTKIGLN
jgi:hypothetical protein